MRNRKRNRMLGYDYSRNGLYFVTICVKDRLRCLGFIGAVGAPRDSPVQNGARVGASRDLPVQDRANGVSGVGAIESPVSNRPNMPKLILNNFGLIVESQIKWLANQYPYVEVHNYVVMPDHVHLIIDIDRARAQAEDVKIKSLSSLIGALKTTTSKLIHNSGFEDFVWQRSFHDSIIRNSNSYHNISRYIDMNPGKWVDKHQGA